MALISVSFMSGDPKELELGRSFSFWAFSYDNQNTVTNHCSSAVEIFVTKRLLTVVNILILPIYVTEFKMSSVKYASVAADLDYFTLSL